MITSQSEKWVHHDGTTDVCQICKEKFPPSNTIYAAVNDYLMSLDMGCYNCNACGKVREVVSSYQLFAIIFFLYQLVCKLCSTKKAYFEDQDKEDIVCDSCYSKSKILGKFV